MRNFLKKKKKKSHFSFYKSTLEGGGININKYHEIKSGPKYVKKKKKINITKKPPKKQENQSTAFSSPEPLH